MWKLNHSFKVFICVKTASSLVLVADYATSAQEVSDLALTVLRMCEMVRHIGQLRQLY